MSTVERQIAERARKHPDSPLTNLHQFIDERFLWLCFKGLKRKSSAGTDSVTWEDYKEEIEISIPWLLSDFKRGTFRAPNIRRTYIPKGDGKLRPLGIPTTEDKVLQSAVSTVLTPIYDNLFYDFSYGFQKDKRAHFALDDISYSIRKHKCMYIIDADMQDYFGSIDHGHLRSFLDKRIKDGVIRKMIDKWLKAGVLDKGNIIYPESGTPQGGIISPLLSNIYLHYVLDEWFVKDIQPLLKEGSFIVRYADDFVLGFSCREDAERVLSVLPKRLGKYGLTLHPEKTCLVYLGADKNNDRGTFDFLGFTHYMGKTRKGYPCLKRRTAKKRLSRSLNAM